MSGNRANNSRIAKNTVFLYVRMALVVFVGFFATRVVLHVLGASDYGVSNVVAGFVSLFSFLNTTFSSTLQRFYNYEGGKKGEEGYTAVFSVGIRVHLALALIVFLFVEGIGIWYINNVMVLPEGRLPAAHVLFQFSVFSMMLLIVQAPFSGAIIAQERMDFFAIVSITDVLLRLLLVLLLPYVPFDQLIAYGSIQLIISLTGLSLYVIYCRRKFSFIKLSRLYDKRLLKELLTFSGWTLFGTFAFLLKGEGVNMLLNVFFGTIVNAARGLACFVNGAITGFTNNMSMAFRPQLVGSYAEGNTDRTFRLLLAQSKLSYCLMLMLSVPVILEIDLLLSIWLSKNVPEYTNIFAALVLVDSLVGSINAPVTQVVYATGKIKVYQIASASINLLLIPTCWVFLKLGFEAWIVFVLAIACTIVCHTCCLIFMHRVFEYSYMEYLKKIVLPCLCMTLLVPVVPYVITIIMADSFVRLIVVCFVSLIISVGLLFIFLSEAERNLLKLLVKKIFYNRRNVQNDRSK